MRYDVEKFFDLSLDMLCIAGKDGYFKRVNPSFGRILGWTPEDLLGRPLVDFVHPDDIEATLREVEKLASGIPTLSFKNRYRRSDGIYRHLVWTAFPEKETGSFFAIARDTTELIETNERYWLALDSSPAALIMTDSQHTIKLVNREAERLFGYSRDQMLGAPIEILLPTRLHQEHQDHRAAFIRDPHPRLMGAGRYLLAVRQDGSEFPVEVGLNPIQSGEGLFVLCSIIDLTFQTEAEEKIRKLAQELEQANVRLAQLASTDQLTGLKNRRAFEEQLSMLIGLAHRTAGSLSLLLIDVDHFKQYNDQYGHLAGDEVLKTMAVLLLKSARQSDVVARYGGEEFATILPDTSAEGAVQLGERLRKTVQDHPWETKGLTISLGACTISFRKREAARAMDYNTQLLWEADRALYHSKNGGRNQLTHFLDIEDMDRTT